MAKRVTGAALRLAREAKKSAQAVGLSYVSDSIPGLRRKKSGTTFRYVDTRGRPVRDDPTLKRIKALVIPPAWRDVWISPHDNGHVQATGRDARGRKQHRYHKRWREVRDQNKYSRMIEFAQSLPAIRARARRHLRADGLSRQKVLAAVIRLLEMSLIRVGNDEYARDNNSFGLTTMRDKHVQVRGHAIQFRFRGKSGKHHEIDIEHPRLAGIVKKCQDLPGQELFQFIDGDGRQRDVTSTDVNEYLREVSGRDFTAKDFRTWAGTVLAAMALKEFEKFDTQTQAKKNLVRAIENVAKRLGNTPSVCKKCYVHPAILDSYLDGSMLKMLQRKAELQIRRSLKELPPEEAAVLALLQKRLATENEPLEGKLRRSLKAVRRRTQTA